MIVYPTMKHKALTFSIIWWNYYFKTNSTAPQPIIYIKLLLFIEFETT